MGQLIDGVWHDTGTIPNLPAVNFNVQLPHFVTGSLPMARQGPTGTGGFIAEKDRYHLYVSLACPWAHRTLIMRKLKGLEPFISVSVVNPLMLENGWTFDDSFPGATGDTLYQHEFFVSALSPRRSTLQRTSYCSRTVGQKEPHHRQQRISGNHPHVQYRV